MAIATGTALAIGAGLTAAGGIGSALISADASRDAARSQRNSLREAQAASEVGFQRAQGLQQPFLETGTQAFNQLADIVQSQAGQQPQGFAPMPEFTFGAEDIQSDPGIQFAQEQARKQVEASAAARGSSLGAGTLQELQDRAIGLSGLQSQQAFNRKLGGFQQNLAGRQLGLSERGQAFSEGQQTLGNLARLADVGPQTATSLSNLALGQAGRTGDLAIQGGNINAAERIAKGQALTQGIGGVTDSLQNLLLMQQLFPKGGGTGDAGGFLRGARG